MPRLSKDTPEALKPYEFHGMDLSTPSGGQVKSDCPWCGSSKWFANVETGLWDCKVCGEKGNALTFLSKLWESAEPDLDQLSENRSVGFDVLKAWGCKVSPIRVMEPLVPGFGPSGKLSNLYRYVKDKSGRRILLATKGMGHGIHGANLYDPKCDMVYLCEGPWDGMALYEALSSVKRVDPDEHPEDDAVFAPTSNVASSLLKGCSVLAVPGANVFDLKWMPYFSGKNVVLMYDSDHPKTNKTTGAVIPPVGWTAMRRIAETMAGHEPPPLSISVLRWGPDGYDPLVKSGTDVRDILIGSDAVIGLQSILDFIEPMPDDWVAGRSPTTQKNGGTELACLECDSWKMLTNSWKKSMKWTEGLDRALSVMLACIASVRLPGDQLWVKVVAEPSSGKSVLCEAVSVSKGHVIANSTLRGFHSGFKTDKDGAEDNSLAKALKDKTLVTKDGDTLLQSPNLEQIFSEARDLYDRVSRTHYRNGINRSYEQAMTWIIAGTNSIRVMDSSELGERFLDCVIDPVDEETERLIQRRKMDSLMANIHDTDVKSGDSPEMVESKQLTGGYIDWLKDHVSSLLASQERPEWAVEKCMDLASFVAHMRARPSIKQDETVGRELSIRLTSQLGRLMMVMGVVLNRKVIDEEVMRRVSRVALDTARGHTMEMAARLYAGGEDGLDAPYLAKLSSMSDTKCRTFLLFLKRIGVVEQYTKPVEPHEANGNGVVSRNGILGGVKPKWRLTPKMTRLYREATTYKK